MAIVRPPRTLSSSPCHPITRQRQPGSTCATTRTAGATGLAFKAAFNIVGAHALAGTAFATGATGTTDVAHTGASAAGTAGTTVTAGATFTALDLSGHGAAIATGATGTACTTETSGAPIQGGTAGATVTTSASGTTVATHSQLTAASAAAGATVTTGASLTSRGVRCKADSAAGTTVTAGAARGQDCPSRKQLGIQPVEVGKAQRVRHSSFLPGEKIRLSQGFVTQGFVTQLHFYRESHPIRNPDPAHPYPSWKEEHTTTDVAT